MSGVAKFFKDSWSVINRAPLTASFAVVLVIIGVVTHVVGSQPEMAELIETFGFGLPALQAGEWWTLFTGVAFAPELWMYLTILPPLIFGAGYIEYRFGALKMLATVIGIHLASVLLVAGFLYVGGQAGWDWARQLSLVRDVGLSNGAFGAVGVATAALGLYWRFRVRLFSVLYCLVMVLYSAEVWDFTHFVALLIGFAIGPWVIGRNYEAVKVTLSAVNARALAASLLVFLALAHIMSKIHPGNGGLLHFGNAPDAGSFLFISVFVFIALWFSYGLYHGRRAAWAIVTLIAIVLLASSGLQFAAEPSIATGFSIFYVVTLLLVLLIFRKSFSARANPATLKKLTVGLLVAALLLAVLHMVILYSIRHQFDPVPSFGQVAVESVVQIFGLSYGEFAPKSGISYFALASINDAWMAFVLVAIIVLIISTRRSSSKEGETLYVKLLKAWGGSTLSWMGTWQNLQYFSNSSKTAILAYHLSGNVAIVLADPIGDRRTVTRLVRDFDKYCHTNGWTIAYFSTSEWVMRILKKQSYKSVHIAQDTVVPLKDLEFSGKSWQSVRSSINKADKLGVSFHSVRLSEASPELREQLEAIEKSWVDDKALPEMGFTLGALKEAEDTEVRMHLAIDSEGVVHGMTSWLPVYRKGGVISGWTLDIMQRKLTEGTMPGVIEFLIAKTALTFKDEGYSLISLSGAPLTGIEHSDNLVERAMHWASVKFEPYYGFSSLHTFKEKFHPEYDSMYLIYKDADQLPNIGIAIGKAYMNDANLLKTAMDLLKDKLPVKSKKK